MTSYNSIRALNFYSWFYQRFEDIAIQWDQRKSRLLHISEMRRLRNWTINTFLATGFSNGCCIYLIVKELLSSQQLYPLEFLLVQWSFVSFAGFWFVVFVSANLYGRNFVFVWNGARTNHLNVRKKVKGKLTLKTCK